jgi:hypothetical protein
MFHRENRIVYLLNCFIHSQHSLEFPHEPHKESPGSFVQHEAASHGLYNDIFQHSMPHVLYVNTIKPSVTYCTRPKALCFSLLDE